LALWAVLTLAPMAAYALPLWQNALADTPTAYLVWIPFLAVGWGMWVLHDVPPYADDAETDGILGVVLLVTVGALLILGPYRWPTLFFNHSFGLILWPLWALAIAWLLFGVGVTGRLLGPLGYLLLAWPPILTAVATMTQGVLLALAIAVLNHVGHLLPWFRTQGGMAGTYLVRSHGVWTSVIVSQACSGADSLLAAAILIPLLLTQFRGPGLRKAVLVAVTLAGAVVLNLGRLGAIIWALHALGNSFTFGVLHPALGFVLFAVLSLSLAHVGRALGLDLQPAGRRTPHLSLAGPFRTTTAVLLSAALGLGLWPLLSVPEGGIGRPIPVASAEPEALLPALAGFRQAVVGRFDDSSILGPSSVSVAEAYAAPSGAYLLAEVWETPNYSALRSYTYNNCLLFHGDELDAVSPVLLGKDAVATSYAVRMPPPVPGGPRAVYVDVEWTTSIQTPQGIRYLRYSVAAPPQPTSAWPDQVLRVTPLGMPTGLLALAAQAPSGRWPQELAATRRALEGFARLFAEGVRAQARPSTS
jgi:exosortase/archaeosortase family protein